MFSFLFGLIIKWIIHLLLTIGILLHIASFVMGFTRNTRLFKFPVSILGSVALGFAIYYQGEETYKEKIAAESKHLEAKLAQAKVESKQANTQIETKILTKTKIIHEKGDVIIHEIKADAVKMDNECKIPPEVVELHNRAAMITGDTK